MRRLILCCVVAQLGACAPALEQRDHLPATETIAVDAREGTMLAFDVSPDDRTIVFDLLGQLWSLPLSGGAARPLTNAVRDTAEDLDPSFSPDGRSVVFRAERRGRTGLWLLDLSSGSVRQLTQLTNPDGFDGHASWSPDGRLIAFTRTEPDSADGQWHSSIRLLDVASGAQSRLRISGLQRPDVRNPEWTPDGRQIAFVAATLRRTGGRIWIVSASGGEAVPLSHDSTNVVAHAFAPDGKRIAFLARDSASRLQIWTLDLAGSAAAAPVQLTRDADVASTRVRWTHDGTSIVYSADGKLKRIGARGEALREIAFDAHLEITRPRHDVAPAQLIEPGSEQPVRAFLGLALSPDAQAIAALALGKLWIVPVGGSAHAIADVPFTARGLSWSPDAVEVAWSAGPFGEENLYAANTRTGAIRQLTSLPGREALPAYSPDGRSIAFMHEKENGVLRVIDAHASSAISDSTQTRNLGAGAVPWQRTTDTYPQWSPSSDALLLIGDFQAGKATPAFRVDLSGKRDTISQFVDSPVFIHWDKAGHLTYLRHDRLWQAPFDGRAVREAARPLGSDAALYSSTANDGSTLYISTDGLRLRTAAGETRHLGWPITYTAPVPPALLIRNARVVDGSSSAASEPSDILIERGRISRIARAGVITTQAQVVDASNKFLLPGLIDLHAHTYQPDLLPAFLYFGVTTVRDQGSAIGPLVAYSDAIAAGVIAGSRPLYGGFQFYSDWPFDEEQGRGIEPEADPAHIERSVGLAHAFGAQHIKTRTFRRWDINARMIAEAHRRGMRATGHCAVLLPLIAAGMDAKEHIGTCATRGAGSPYESNDMLIYDDEVQLYRAARIGVVPTISYFALAANVSGNPKLLEADTEVMPFVPAGSLQWMQSMNPAARPGWVRSALEARVTTLKLARAGVLVGTGTDIWQVPSGVHMELEELVAAGLTPAEAIRAATSSAARIAGADHELGAVAEGRRADLLLLDADPLADIRNTRRISAVIQNGRLVDRAAIRRAFAPMQ